MRAKGAQGRDYALIRLFLSGYEDYAWRGASERCPESEVAGGVEMIVTRSDGVSLAFEHTLIEPFIGDTADVKRLERVLLSIEEDPSLKIPDCFVKVDIPALLLQPGQRWVQVAADLHDFLRSSIATFPHGPSSQHCPTTGIPGVSEIPLIVTVQTIRGDGPHLVIRRYHDVDKAGVVKKALETKVEKLTKALATKRILLLEHNQWNMSGKTFNPEIDRQRSAFPGLASVDEIWFVDSMGFPRLTEFRRYNGAQAAEIYSFANNRLIARSRDGLQVPVYPPEDEQP
jgi:hypothetical protein